MASDRQQVEPSRVSPDATGSRRKRKTAGTLRPALQQILDAITDAPAWIRNGRHDVLAMNQLARALYAPVLADPRRPANTTRFVYLHPEEAEQFFVDYDQIARDAAAMLRLEAGRNPARRGSSSRWSASCRPAASCSGSGGRPRTSRFHRSGRKRLRHPGRRSTRPRLRGDATSRPNPGLQLNVYTAAAEHPDRRRAQAARLLGRQPGDPAPLRSRPARARGCIPGTWNHRYCQPAGTRRWLVSMRATVMYGARDMRVEDVPDACPAPTDAVVRVLRACICGSDLWAYRDGADRQPASAWATSSSASSRRPAPMSALSSAATSSSRPSSGPTAPATSAARACTPPAARRLLGLGRLGRRPGRGRARPVRRRHPGQAARSAADDALMPSLLTLSDVMGTGHHAALGAASARHHGRGRRRRRGRPVRRASPPSGSAPNGSSPGPPPRPHRHRPRFGATDVVAERGEEAVAPVRELTGGEGAHGVIEASAPSSPCARRSASPATAAPSATSASRIRQRHRIASADVRPEHHPARRRRPGARLHRGAAARRPGRPIDPARLRPDGRTDGVPAGYQAMDERKALKVLIKP